MSNVNKVNEFFCGDKYYSRNTNFSNKKGIYRNLLDFSHLPYTGWSFFKASQTVDATGIASGVIALMCDVATKALLSPVLLPATAITASLALIGAIITGLAHIISLSGAAVMDCFSKQNEENGLPLLTK